ncbi:MAG TPA: YMGG-like glycine zipper-containing protein [Micavibrio sp.]|nr:YMGG-like glycine zipper-containing protein [Micavibrio sp.]
MKKFAFILIASAALMLAACGNTKGERALSGAGIGAGAGALGSAVTGGNPWAGAAVGGVAGGVVGAVTDKDDINLD